MEVTASPWAPSSPRGRIWAAAGQWGRAELTLLFLLSELDVREDGTGRLTMGDERCEMAAAAAEFQEDVL